MLFQKYIEQFLNFTLLRAVVGLAGTVSANLFILGAAEHLTSVVRLSLA